MPSSASKPKYRLAIGVAVVALIGVIITLIVISVNGSDESSANDGGNLWYVLAPFASQDDSGCECSKDCDCSTKDVCNKDAAGCCAKCKDCKCVKGMVTSSGCEEQACECSKDSDCSVKAACGGKGGGCCAKCKDCKCVKGMVTSSGCEEPRAYGMSHGADCPLTAGPASASISTCSNHQDAYMKACFDRGDYSAACCGVCVNGLSYPGVRGPDGVCQTAVQQVGYSGMGQQPPNTYMISSSGPKYGVAMGGCNVDSVGSSLAMYTGFH